MTRGNSASRNDLGRRRFLGGFLGLGTGATVFGAVPTGPSAARNARLGANLTAQPMREYERRLARTERMEVLGYPRDWSVVRDGFHPFHPQRIAIMPSGTRLNYGNRCGQQLRKKIDEEIERALVGHVCRSPFRDTWGESEYPAWCLTSSLMGRLDDWRSFSRMGRIDAARHLNEITVRLLDEVKT